VPAGFVGEEGPLHALKGTFTVLADGGMSDIEILRSRYCVRCRAATSSRPAADCRRR